MAILTIDDFTSTYIVGALGEDPVKAAKYYQKGDNFYQTLLNRFSINRDYIPLPENVEPRVRDILEVKVNCIISKDNIEPATREIMQDEASPDPWKARADEWCDMISDMVDELTAGDFYDPDNLPPDGEDTSSNPLVIQAKRG